MTAPLTKELEALGVVLSRSPAGRLRYRAKGELPAALLERLRLAWEAADTTREGLALAEVLRRLHGLPELAEALSELLPTRDGSPPTPHRFGHFLRTIKGRLRDVGDGIELTFQQQTMRTRAGTVRWTVRREGSGNAKADRPPVGNAGNAGYPSLPTRARCQFEDKASSDNSAGLGANHPLRSLRSPPSPAAPLPLAPSLAGPSAPPPLPPNAELAASGDVGEEMLEEDL